MTKPNCLSILLFSLFVSGLLSCNTEYEEPVFNNVISDYYPVKLNSEWIYQSDSIIYSQGGKQKDTLRSFIREIITDTLRDATGNLIYKTDRYIRKNGSDDWHRINAWTVYINNSSVVRTEENIPLVKLVSPLKEGTRFRSNVNFDDNIKSEVGGEFIAVYSGWRPVVESVSTDISYRNQTLSAIKIKVADVESIIDLRKVNEYYVKGIGLVRKEMTIMDTDGNNPDNPWDVKVKKGFIHTLQLIDNK